MAFSLRFKKKTRGLQNERYQALMAAPVGIDRIALLIRFATAVVFHGSRIRRPDDLAYRRKSFTKQKRQWMGELKPGICRACGRGPVNRCRHHILPLASGGSNGAKNLIAICHECHAQIHLHMQPPVDTDDTLYRSARKHLSSAMQTGRLVKKTPSDMGS